jgi:NAD(P)H-hydrate repair Nnr-like enzyme with NAD(P)H-hydrate dehydratase domain
MVIGVVFIGVLSGMAAAIVSLSTGHPFETALLAYTTAGLIGSLGFAAMAARPEVDVLP